MRGLASRGRDASGFPLKAWPGATHIENGLAAPTVTLHLRISGTTTIRQRTYTTDGAIGLRFQPLDVFAIYPLAAADYVEMRGQAVSANVTFGHGSTAALATRLEVIGPLPPS